jgi:ribonuclease Y
LRRIEEETREEADARSRRVIAEAIQRVPTGDIVDNVVAVVRLPSDDMKGRIIGREGRNIRAIEMATGVDLIIDETPEAILVSSFDPLRRAIAITALERMIEDGRIHPARIEEAVTRARQETEEGLETLGEAAAFDLGITGLPPRLARMLGKLKYRIVCGYNLLDHSLSVAHLAQQMANLLGARTEVALRAGLLHEIGQVSDAERVATHPFLEGADLAARFGEAAPVVEAIRGLQAAAPERSVESILLKTAERVVVARPGARDDNLDIFIERMKHLEEIAGSFSGVSRAFAMRAGKEVRVIVETDMASDHDVVWLSKDITKRIETEVTFPGSIRISVIRETRAVDYAT